MKKKVFLQTLFFIFFIFLIYRADASCVLFSCSGVECANIVIGETHYDGGLARNTHNVSSFDEECNLNIKRVYIDGRDGGLDCEGKVTLQWNGPPVGVADTGWQNLLESGEYSSQERNFGSISKIVIEVGRSYNGAKCDINKVSFDIKTEGELRQCMEEDWNYTLFPSNCPESSQQTKIWQKIGNCSGGVFFSNETVPCVFNQSSSAVLIFNSTIEYFNFVESGSIQNFSQGQTIENLDSSEENVSFTSCVPYWQCSDWGECINSFKRRVCVDINGCGLENSSLDLLLACNISSDEKCTPSWECSEYFPEECPENGKKERSCVDINSCSTKEGKPLEVITCKYLAKDNKTSSFLFFSILFVLLLVVVSLGVYFYFKKRGKSKLSINPISSSNFTSSSGIRNF